MATLTSFYICSVSNISYNYYVLESPLQKQHLDTRNVTEQRIYDTADVLQDFIL